MSTATVDAVSGLTGHQLVEQIFQLDREGLPRVRTAILYGRPGTGKTSAAVHFAKRISDHVIKVTLNDGDMAAKYEGHFIPVGNNFEWMNGQLIEAWTYDNGKGCPIVIDEIDHASSEVMSLLLAGLDDPAVAQLSLPGHPEPVKPGPKFVAIASTNQTPKALIDPLADRFEAKILVDHPSQEMLNTLHPEIHPVMEAVQAAYASKADPVTFRDFKHYTDFRHKGFSQEIAAQLAFSEKFADILTAIKLAS